MIQREHMMGKEPLPRAGWDVAHDGYRLFSVILWPAPIFFGRLLILYAGIEPCWLDDHTLALCTSI